MKTKAENYTVAQTTLLVAEYKAKGQAAIPELAKKLGKSDRSIVAKLCREGVYVKPVYKSKTGKVPETKADIVGRIALLLGTSAEVLDSLSAATKQALQTVEAGLITAAKAVNEANEQFDIAVELENEANEQFDIAVELENEANEQFDTTAA